MRSRGVGGGDRRGQCDTHRPPTQSGSRGVWGRVCVLALALPLPGYKPQERPLPQFPYLKSQEVGPGGL